MRHAAREPTHGLELLGLPQLRLADAERLVRVHELARARVDASLEVVVEGTKLTVRVLDLPRALTDLGFHTARAAP